jgi:DNA-binding transcriptional ArsR family regulator
MRTKPSIDLGTLFFGAYRRQVLGLLLLHPGESFHLREIARDTNTQPGTLRRELMQLADAGVLSRERVGNLVRYKADSACPIYDELRGILKKPQAWQMCCGWRWLRWATGFRWLSYMVRSRAVPSAGPATLM